MSVVFQPFWYTFWRVSYAASFCCWNADFCIVGPQPDRSPQPERTTQLTPRMWPCACSNGSRGGAVWNELCLGVQGLDSRPCSGFNLEPQLAFSALLHSTRVYLELLQVAVSC